MSAPPTLREALRFWTRLGFVSFGGPTGQIALMHVELVERRRWVSEPQFLHALNFCMLLPGPEAQQLATYVGWLLHGTGGGIAAGVLFVLPSVAIMMALSFVHAAYGATPWVTAASHGLKPAVVAIVAAAGIRIGRRTLRGPFPALVAAAAFASLWAAEAPFPAVIVGAALAGLVWGWVRRARGLPAVAPEAPPEASRDASPEPASDPPREPAPGAREPGPGPPEPAPGAPPEPSPQAPVAAASGGAARAAKVLAVHLVLWWGPVLLVGALLGTRSTFFQEGVFFGKTALVTFGGAYAVLPYVAQASVERYGWVTPGQMMDGLGLAETTPGPLIMVLQFVGFLGGWRAPGPLPPWAGGILGALITTWVTFVPCFLWIFLGAPYVERLRGRATLEAAMSAVTAAVVGVIANLALWFALHTLFPSGGGLAGLDLFAAGVAAVAGTGLVLLRWSVVPVVLASAAAGVVWHLVH